MLITDKTELLKSLELKSEVVEIDGGEVNVSEIGAADYIKLWTDPANQTDGAVDMAKFTPKLLAYCITDSCGNRVFSDDDVPAISRTSHGPFLKLAEVARRLNGLSGEEVKNS